MWVRHDFDSTLLLYVWILVVVVVEWQLQHNLSTTTESVCDSEDSHSSTIQSTSTTSTLLKFFFYSFLLNKKKQENQKTTIKLVYFVFPKIICYFRYFNTNCVSSFRIIFIIIDLNIFFQEGEWVEISKEKKIWSV
jgi:hypothetical protein